MFENFKYAFNMSSDAQIHVSRRVCVLFSSPRVATLRLNQRTIGPENAHLKPDLGVLSHNETTLTLNTHTPLLTS